MTVTVPGLGEVREVSHKFPETEHGHLEDLRNDPIGLLHRVRDECGDVGWFQLAGKHVILLSGSGANEFFFRSADEDLVHALSHSLTGDHAAGALLFTCNGRGSGMFGEPHHDARAVARSLGTQAVAGFFCGGEIGPVGGRAFVHGFTATLAVFL